MWIIADNSYRIGGNIGTVNNLKRTLEEMNALHEGNDKDSKLKIKQN
jgi:hypothetical protein